MGLEGRFDAERALAHACAEVGGGSYIAGTVVLEGALLADLDCDGAQGKAVQGCSGSSGLAMRGNRAGCA